MASTTTAEVKLGELRARIEFETVIDGATASLRPVKVQLVVVVPNDRMAGSTHLPASVVVLGDVEVVE